jgi:hypothetical protein
VEALIAAGKSREDAEREALERFGPYENHAPSCWMPREDARRP